MRRSDREIKDKIMIEKLIAGEQVLRIAFYDEGDIYIVPVNYDGVTIVVSKIKRIRLSDHITQIKELKYLILIKVKIQKTKW